MGAGHVLSDETQVERQADADSAPSSPSAVPIALLRPDTKPRQQDTEEGREKQSADGSADKRQSVDWYGGLAADRYPSPTMQVKGDSTLPLVEEADETPSLGKDVRDVTEVEESQKKNSDLVAEGETIDEESDVPDTYFDMSSCKEIQKNAPKQRAGAIWLIGFVAATKVRSLYPYDGQRDQDASFSANLLIVAHPAKDQQSDWLYGIVPATGSRGWLPKTYVEELGT